MTDFYEIVYERHSICGLINSARVHTAWRQFGWI